MNTINLIGRMTDNPELKESKNTKYIRFSIAVNRISDSKITDFFNCTAFGKTAEIIKNYCKKGQQVGLVGSMETSKKDKITYYNVIVSSVSLISNKNNDNDNSNKETDNNYKESKNKSNQIDDDDYPF